MYSNYIKILVALLVATSLYTISCQRRSKIREQVAVMDKVIVSKKSKIRPSKKRGKSVKRAAKRSAETKKKRSSSTKVAKRKAELAAKESAEKKAKKKSATGGEMTMLEREKAKPFKAGKKVFPSGKLSGTSGGDRSRAKAETSATTERISPFSFMVDQIDIGDIFKQAEDNPDEFERVFSLRDILEKSGTGGNFEIVLKKMKEELAVEVSESPANAVLSPSDLREVALILEGEERKVVKEYLFWTRPKVNMNMNAGYERAEGEALAKFYSGLKQKGLASIGVYNSAANRELKKALKELKSAFDAGDKLFVINKVAYAKNVFASFDPAIESIRAEEGYKSLRLITRVIIPKNKGLSISEVRGKQGVSASKVPVIYWGYQQLGIEEVGAEGELTLEDEDSAQSSSLGY